MFGEVVCRHESKHVGFEAIRVWVVERLDGCLFHRPVHPLGLSIGPRLIRFGEFVLIACCLQTRSKMWPPKRDGGGVSAPVLRQVGERHAVVGQHGVNGIWGRGKVVFTADRATGRFAAELRRAVEAGRAAPTTSAGTCAATAPASGRVQAPQDANGIRDPPRQPTSATSRCRSINHSRAGLINSARLGSG